jgi:hypothetical protein
MRFTWLTLFLNVDKSRNGADGLPAEVSLNNFEIVLRALSEASNVLV